MNLNDLHRRLLQDVLEIGNAFPLVLTGGYAVQAHRIVDRFSRDIDVATDSTVTMEAIVTTVVDGLTGRGWRVEVIGVDPHGARMMAADQGSGEQCELDILRESFSRPPETTPYGPVLALDDVISDLRRWAQSWSDDLNRRLYAGIYVGDEDGAT
jgi:Nucleotidyl transferase AbiEii toxin, Type IV TA system